MDNVLAFKYLGRVMTEGDYDWPAVAVNLSKARKIWGRFSWILCRKGGDARVSGQLFQGGGTGGVAIWGGEVGTYPEDGAGPG